MSYTKQEWEPASQEAAKIPEDKLRGRLIETMIDRDRLKAEPGWQAYERNTKWACGEIAWRDKEIAELREKSYAWEKAYLAPCRQCEAEKMWHEAANRVVAELREKLGASQNERLRRALHGSKVLALAGDIRAAVDMIDEALAQPAGEKP